LGRDCECGCGHCLTPAGLDCPAKLRPLLRAEQQPGVDRMLARARQAFGHSSGK
jgi:hypothetical protein